MLCKYQGSARYLHEILISNASKDILCGSDVEEWSSRAALSFFFESLKLYLIRSQEIEPS